MYKLTREQCESVSNKAAQGLTNYCLKNQIHYLVVGSSGGLDSAITLGLADLARKKAAEHDFKLTPVGLIMPCESIPDAERLGREVIQHFGAEEIKIDLTEIYQVMKGIIDPKMPGVIVPRVDEQVRALLERTGGEKALADWEYSDKISRGNTKARLRMLIGTYHVARRLGGMVLSTDNLSEYWTTFWTLHGDVGDFGMIQHLMKGLELYDIASYLGVPAEIIAAKPDDGLGISGGDDDQLGGTYLIRDRIMVTLIKNGFNPDGADVEVELAKIVPIPDVDPKFVKELATRVLRGTFKRKGTITLSRAELGLPTISEVEL